MFWFSRPGYVTEDSVLIDWDNKWYTVTIPGEPVGKQSGKISGSGPKKWLRLPRNMRDWQEMAVSLIRHEWGDRPPIHGPVQTHVIAVKKRPQRLKSKKYPTIRIFRTVKPDADNVHKAVGDALEKAGVMKNDSQIADQRCQSFYTAIGEEPCVEVRFRIMTVLFPDQ